MLAVIWITLFRMIGIPGLFGIFRLVNSVISHLDAALCLPSEHSFFYVPSLGL